MALVPLSLVKTAAPAPRGGLYAPAWVGDLGASLAPLVGVHDRVLVVPCTRAELSPGDLVVIESPDRRTLGQVVVAAVPLAFATLRGHKAPEGAELLGRIIAVRRDEEVYRLPRGLRPLAGAVARSLYRARTHTGLLDAVRGARAALTSKYTLPLRRVALGRTTLRLLRPDDLAAVVAFAGKHLVLPTELVRSRLMTGWQEQGAAAGVFGRGGRLLAFAFVDDYRDEGLDVGGAWIRSVFVVPRARGMGMAQRLIDLLCDTAFARGAPWVRAAIEHDNLPSLAAFFRQGFRAVDMPLNAELNRAWRAVGSVREWTIVERRP